MGKRDEEERWPTRQKLFTAMIHLGSCLLFKFESLRQLSNIERVKIQGTVINTLEKKMQWLAVWMFVAVCFLVTANQSFAAPAIVVLGKDYSFPNKIAGLPAKLSDFEDLQINSFETDDGAKLTYWEAGTGQPLIFIPGWSANGAEYINVMYLLRKHYHVYVLDPRNQGPSQKVKYGTRISRYAADLREFTDHIGVHSAYYCGWSMGASVLWSYIDLFGTQGIQKAVFIDEPPSILSRPGWTGQDRRNAGAMVDSPEQLIQRLHRERRIRCWIALR
jgi:non-heme chloroperoxidase